MKNYYKQVINLLAELHKEHPSYGLARHISTATADYGDIWSMTDKELLFALEKYKTEIDMDSDFTVSDEYVNKIIKDSENLSLDEEDENF